MDVPTQRVSRTLPPARLSARDAREFVSATLQAWHVPADPLDTACLLATELVTNAVLHAGSDVELSVEGTGTAVRVEVTDASAVVPTPRPSHAMLGTTGRGLTLVGRMSTTWGVTPRDPGKSVWFEIAMDERQS